jgi:hypothetical protein
MLLGATPLVDVRFGVTTWCDQLAADTEGETTCASLGVNS